VIFDRMMALPKVAIAAMNGDPMGGGFEPEALAPNVWDQKMAEIPMGRPGEPSEVASVALFYASPLSSYMTGTVAEVAGGRFM